MLPPTRLTCRGALTSPLTVTTRHRDFFRLNARNRVWLARRNLPWVVGVPYVLSWTAVQVGRSVRSPATLRPWLRGWWEGWRSDAGPRRPMRWNTSVRMAGHGRPPVV